MTTLDAVNVFLSRLGMRPTPSDPAPPNPAEFLSGEICSSEPGRRVPPAFLGEASPKLTPGVGIAPRAGRVPQRSPASWSPDQYARFGKQVREYLAQDAALIPHHAAWHEVNGPGGTRGRGSGLAFLQMHHEMQADIARWITASGRDQDLLPLAEWWPSQPVPRELGDIERFSNQPQLPTPSWLSLAGGTQPAPIFGYTRLADFKDPDELGRALGTGFPDNLGYHGGGHAAVGGIMWSRRAPEDPLFWLWHSHIEGIVETWLGTDNGRAWLATEDGRRWRETTGNQHHAMSPTDAVSRRTEELVRLRATDPAAYEAYLNGSSFAPAQLNTWPADALPINVQSALRFPPLGVTVQTLATGLDVPSRLTFATDGRVFFRERNGGVRVIRDGVVQPDPLPGGAVGAEGDLRRESGGAVLLTSTKIPGWQNRLFTPAEAERGVRMLTIDDANIVREQQTLFQGVFGRVREIVQGPDGYLYMTTSNRDEGGSRARDDDQLLRIVPITAQPAR